MKLRGGMPGAVGVSGDSGDSEPMAARWRRATKKQRRKSRRGTTATNSETVRGSRDTAAKACAHGRAFSSRRSETNKRAALDWGRAQTGERGAWLRQAPWKDSHKEKSLFWDHAGKACHHIYRHNPSSSTHPAAKLPGQGS